VTILERIRGERRPVQFGRIARDLMNRDISALGRDAVGVLDQVKDIRTAAADAIEHFQSMAADAADRAGGALEHVGDEAVKATKDVNLDAVKGKGVDDIAEKLRKSLPTDRISRIVENLERELPTTDKGRYDRAYSRGWARARTSFIVVGAATGIAAGIAGAWLLDPKQGPRRRAALRDRLRTATKDVSGQLGRTATMTSDRARGFAIERGLLKPDSSAEVSGGPARDANGRFAPAGAPRIPVMDIPAASPAGFDGPEPVMPLADGPITDPSSIEREPVTAPDSAFEGTTASDDGPGFEGALDQAADPFASTNGDEPTAVGEDAERGTWHTTI
jgi:hypothetical protein